MFGNEFGRRTCLYPLWGGGNHRKKAVIEKLTFTIFSYVTEFFRYDFKMFCWVKNNDFVVKKNDFLVKTNYFVVKFSFFFVKTKINFGKISFFHETKNLFHEKSSFFGPSDR